MLNRLLWNVWTTAKAKIVTNAATGVSASQRTNALGYSVYLLVICEYFYGSFRIWSCGKIMQLPYDPLGFIA
jgi:hypothetical protein